MTTPTRLYRWFDADGTLLYVGISSRPAERAHEHIGTSDWIADTAAEDDPRIRLHVTARLADMLRDVANEAAWNRSRTVDLTCTSGVLTPTQIAAILGVGLARVSQLRKRAFDLAARTAPPADTEETQR